MQPALFWYTLYVKSRHEKKVSQALHCAGYEHFSHVIGRLGKARGRRSCPTFQDMCSAASRWAFERAFWLRRECCSWSPSQAASADCRGRNPQSAPGSKSNLYVETA